MTLTKNACIAPNTLCLFIAALCHCVYGPVYSCIPVGIDTGTVEFIDPLDTCTGLLDRMQ